MTRHEARTQAFLFLFEKIFNDSDIDEIIESAMLARQIKVNDYVKTVFYGVEKNTEIIDTTIEKYCIGWEKSRLSKVILAVLRLAIYEMLFEDNIPLNVSISEAVEITKKYAEEKDASFVNGVLSSFYKDIQTDKQKKEQPSEDTV